MIAKAHSSRNWDLFLKNEVLKPKCTQSDQSQLWASKNQVPDLSRSWKERGDHYISQTRVIVIGYRGT